MRGGNRPARARQRSPPGLWRANRRIAATGWPRSRSLTADGPQDSHVPATTYFETERLVARAFTPADVEPFAAYRADPEVARYQSWSDFALPRRPFLVDRCEAGRPGFPATGSRSRWKRAAEGALSRRPRTARRGGRAAGGGGRLHAGARPAGQGLRDRGPHPASSTGCSRRSGSTGSRRHRRPERAGCGAAGAGGFRREAHLVENVFFKGAWGSELFFGLLENEWAARRS